jgi:hypothetical protein
VITDRPGREAEIAAEKRAQQDREIKTLLGQIEARKHAPPLPPPSAAEELLWRADAAAWVKKCQELKAATPAAVAAELDTLETELAAMRAAAPAAPEPVMRFGQPVSKAQLNYEAQQAAWQAKRARPAGGGCGHCMNCRDGGAQWCLFQ